MDGFTFLLRNVILDHLVRQIPRAHRKIPSCPQMTTPKRLLQMRKLLQQYPRADSLQPLHDHAHIYVRSVPHQYVNVVAGYLTRQNCQFMLHRYLAYQVAHPKRYLPSQYLLAVFGDPNQMHLEIMLRVRAQYVPFHATTLHDPILRLQGEGFPPSPRETLRRQRRALPVLVDIKEQLRHLVHLPPEPDEFRVVIMGGHWT